MGRIRPGKAVSWLLSLAIVIGIMPITAFAQTLDTVDVPTLSGGGSEAVDVTITVTPNEETGTTTTTTETPVGGDTTASGLNVNYKGTTVTEGTDGNGPLVSGESHYTVSNSSGTYGAEGGSSTTVEERPITAPVDVPLTDDQTNDANKNTVTGNSAGTTTIISGNTIGGTYDCNSETVIEQGSVTTTTTDISITETVDPAESQINHIVSSAEATADNDLCIAAGSLKFDPDKKFVTIDGYEYVFVGLTGVSQFWTDASFEYTDPETGESVSSETGSGPSHFLLYNPETGKYATAYCADLLTGAEINYSYNIVNLEDSTYYSDDAAAMIRSIALNGYWGTESGIGGLAAVKSMMTSAKSEDGASIFSEDEIKALTDGIALSATQYAIWTFSNEVNKIEFPKAYYTYKNEDNVMTDTWEPIPENKNASIELLFKLYNYLIQLEPTNAEQNTSDTIINQDNFLKDLSVTVVEKADHANNLDTDTTNDAYVTNLTFALVVTPSTENGDDLVVKVIDKGNNILASGRIAGELKDGETRLTADKNGNYTFSGITLIEGEQNFNITLEGIQNLEQGVYLYTSEVRNGIPSQTMVGIAEGERSVDVSMNIAFEFSVDDEIVAKEHVWRSEWTNSGNPDPKPTTPSEETLPKDPADPELEIPDGNVPLGSQTGDSVSGTPNDEVLEIPDAELPEAEVPVSNVPRTGDGSGLWLGLTALCACGLAALTLTGRKREQT